MATTYFAVNSILILYSVNIEANDDSDEDNNQEEPEFDKQMGDLEEEADKLDEQIWGSDEEQDDQESNVCIPVLSSYSLIRMNFKTKNKNAFD